MSTQLMLFMTLVMGGAAAYLAKQRKKDPFLWFFIGSFFGLLGVLYLYFFAKSPKKDPETAVQTPPTPIKLAPPASQKYWYYLNPENQQFGPMSYDALNQAWKEGKISVETYVWNEDLENWKLFGELISEG